MAKVIPLNRPTRIIGLLCCSAILSGQAIAELDDKIQALAPTSKWIVDYENEGCQLARQFGEGKDRVIASFSRYGPGTSFKLVLSGQPLKLGKSGEIEVRFGPNESEQKLEFWPGTLSEEIPALIFTRAVWITPASPAKFDASKRAIPIEDVYPKRDEAREKAITYLRLGSPLTHPIQLQLGPMDKAFGALEKCVDDLMSTWGIDVAKHRSLKREVIPKGNPGNWVNTADYPIKMLRQGQPALVEFRLDIDEKGKPIGCHIQQTTRPLEFDNAVCVSLMRRSKFEPAIDADNNSIRSYWKSTVRFSLPK